jgi:hypothetical protein
MGIFAFLNEQATSPVGRWNGFGQAVSRPAIYRSEAPLPKSKAEGKPDSEAKAGGKCGQTPKAALRIRSLV